MVNNLSSCHAYNLQTDQCISWLSDFEQTQCDSKKQTVLCHFDKQTDIQFHNGSIENKIKDVRTWRNTVTFPSEARRSTTASTNVLCSIRHLCSGLLKSGFGHYLEGKKKPHDVLLHLHLNVSGDVKERMKLKKKASECYRFVTPS